jgi:hypothetical protein
MGEMLNFTTAAPTRDQHAEGMTVYEATAHGVTYRVIGTLVDPAVSVRRTFRAFRVVGESGHSLHPAGPGGPLGTRAAAYAEAEADLAEVMRDRAAMTSRVLRSCCSTFESDRHAEFCVSPDAKGERHPVEQPGPGQQSAWTVFHDKMSEAIRAADEAVQAAVRQPQPADPATEDSVPDLVDRVVRRAQYLALREVLSALDGWIEGMRENAAPGSLLAFHQDDIRRMVNDAAHRLGTAQPWKTDA